MGTNRRQSHLSTVDLHATDRIRFCVSIPIIMVLSTSQFAGDGASPDVKAFLEVFVSLADKSEESKSARRKEWPEADTSRNGVLSFGMAKRWVQRRLCKVHGQKRGTKLFKKYAPIYIRAFYSAKDVPGTENSDYVYPTGFRLLICYLCVYALAFDAFDVIDKGSSGSGDRDQRMSLDDWTKGCSKVSNHGFVALSDAGEDAGDVFDRVDTNGGGMVMLTEWCHFLKETEIAAGTSMGWLIHIGGAIPDSATTPERLKKGSPERTSEKTDEVGKVKEFSIGKSNERNSGAKEQIDEKSIKAVQSLEFEVAPVAQPLQETVPSHAIAGERGPEQVDNISEEERDEASNEQVNVARTGQARQRSALIEEQCGEADGQSGKVSESPSLEMEPVAPAVQGHIPSQRDVRGTGQEKKSRVQEELEALRSSKLTKARRSKLQDGECED
jgi:hypothetical protein